MKYIAAGAALIFLLAGCTSAADASAQETCTAFSTQVLAPLAEADERFIAGELDQQQLWQAYGEAASALQGIDPDPGTAVASMLAAVKAVPAASSSSDLLDLDPQSAEWLATTAALADACAAVGVELPLKVVPGS